MTVDRRSFALGISALLASGAVSPASADDAITRAARALWRRALVVDGNLGAPIDSAELPLPRATLDIVRASGLTAIKTSLGGFNNSFEDTLAELALNQRVIETHPDYFTQIRTVADFAAAKSAGKLGILFGFESAACLEDKVERIELFRDLGVRVMQLSYNLASPFAAGVMAPPEATLTDLGRQAVAKINEVGVALDLSHANAASTAAAMDASARPVVMTHGSCAAIYAHPRAKTDAQLRALAAKGGVFGVFDLPYLVASPRQPNLDDYMAHMTHALDVMGEDHVGIGSDTSFGAMDNSPAAVAEFQQDVAARRAAGVSAPGEDRMPFTEGLNRPDRALAVADALMRRGYPARVAEKVLGANFVRVFSEIW
jgi:membrane dipeptidase